MGYLGGKGNCFSRVIGEMPLHRVYIETHLGGGAIMRAKRRCERQIGIDADERVIAAREAEGAPCELIHDDAANFLRRFPFSGEELVYSDPPYPLETRDHHNRYRHDYGAQDHTELLEVLTGLNCRVLVSGQPTALYCERLAGWRRIEFRCGGRRGARAEVLWANFPEPETLHHPIKAGANFRERELIKRRLANISRKVQRMTAPERTQFVDWLVRNYPEQVLRASEDVACSKR